MVLKAQLTKIRKVKNCLLIKRSRNILCFEIAIGLTPNGLEVKERLYQYYDLVKASGIKKFEKAIETFKNWQKEIMNSFGYDLHNGFIEGINNQTKVIKRNVLVLNDLIVLD